MDTMKPKYCIKWLDHKTKEVMVSYFHTDYIVSFTAKLRAMDTLTVITIHRA